MQLVVSVLGQGLVSVVDVRRGIILMARPVQSVREVVRSATMEIPVPCAQMATIKTKTKNAKHVTASVKNAAVEPRNNAPSVTPATTS